MKICLAQTQSSKGEVRNNIREHLIITKRAIAAKSDLIVFPELSITSYEPGSAKVFSVTVESSIFDPFQELAHKNEITIGLGMPTDAKRGINISMRIFQPNIRRIAYSKQILHPAELAYFICGSEQTFLNIKVKKIAICYEALQGEHFLKAKQNGAEIYIAREYWQFD